MKLFDVYPLFNIDIVKGKGCHVWDAEGNEYLDLYGGHAVISVGHCHPYYVQKLTEQLNKLGFYSNSVINSLQVELAEKLGKLSGYDDYSLFLINSGAEANENALKLASFHNHKKRVVSFKKAFHGRTSAAVKVTDNPAIIAPINDTIPVTFVPLNDIKAVEAELQKGDVSSVIIEGIQGVGGIQQPSDLFMQELRALCTQYNVVLILDEIQSGYGRTGKFFAHQYAGIKPDMITVAKGIGNGFPLAGVLISPEFKPVYGMLGTTFGGNHLACAAAIAVLDIMENEKLLDNAKNIGDYLIDELAKLPGIKEIRGRGLMIGIEFEGSIKEIRSRLLFEEKVFTGVAGTNTIRLLPPLCLTLEEAKDFMQRFKRVLGLQNN
ncbi:aspartate aminotransferase family protein [Macellibacteroides fermentans]|jgi:acetylornithine/N-succinyldiaminopimelate aminotransferase|uniref:aspartate aminotransferase family protein n=2 Tax=Porphyromonadaceae TaxID=171551 RepID=UPI002B65A8BF|nr:aspartate aminotransferase family protein [Parabacteroides sp.]HNP90500.1 aspartate aminotransferase family protein [Macellibacteroides fermentans]HRG12416.1 aspartate aminotransferase family protein [Macellibacteroides fermentans]